LAHALYLNNGDGTFREVTEEAGLKPGKGLGVLVADFDDDGRPDIYVANDTEDNYLYLNRGNVKFQEVGVAGGVAAGADGLPNGSMGVDAADYDGSGRLSIFVANFEKEAHALYRNLGGAQFQHASRAAGITAIGLSYVGWGTGFFDFDRDGAEDLFISNGHAYRYPADPGAVAQHPVLFRNHGQPAGPSFPVRFEDVGARGGPYFQGRHRGRGVAFGDLDNDGRTDIVISHCNEPVVLLRNEVDEGNHWLGVALTGKPSPDAVGAKLTLEADGRKLVRTIKGGGSYLSASDRRVVFGLGPARRFDRLTVRWPSGRVQNWVGLDIDRYWRLVEGEEGVQGHPPSPGP
jgi:hypothetical protein